MNTVQAIAHNAPTPRPARPQPTRRQLVVVSILKRLPVTGPALQAAFYSGVHEGAELFPLIAEALTAGA